MPEPVARETILGFVEYEAYLYADEATREDLPTDIDRATVEKVVTAILANAYLMEQLQQYEAYERRSISNEWVTITDDERATHERHGSYIGRLVAQIIVRECS